MKLIPEVNWNLAGGVLPRVCDIYLCQGQSDVWCKTSREILLTLTTKDINKTLT